MGFFSLNTTTEIIAIKIIETTEKTIANLCFLVIFEIKIPMLATGRLNAETITATSLAKGIRIRAGSTMMAWAL